MKRVLLVAINAKFIHSNLAIRYLSEYTNELNYTGEIREFSINDRIENILEEIILWKPDIVGFSCYIWNIDYVKRLTELIKRIDNSIGIFYGGPEVSYDSIEVIKENPVDYIIEGEGEETYKEFLEWQLNLRNLESIKGLYYRENNQIKYAGSRALIDMEKIIFPYKHMEELENKVVYYESSRGCPFRCKYCLSSTTHGVRFLSIERVKRELQFFMDAGVSLVKFVDRTFNCNHKFAMAIWDFIIQSHTDTCFHFEISADLLKEEELALLRNAPQGRIQFEVGVQTTNPVILNNINRYVSFSDIKEKVVELEKLGNVKQHLDLIAGLPGEDLESFKNSFNDVYSIQPEEIQLGFLKLLKGSSMRQEAKKWGIEYSPYVPYEVLKTSTMSYHELIELKKVEAMVDKYYNSGKFKNIIKYFINRYQSAYDFYKDLSEFFSSQGFFKRSISSKDYYKVFIDFHENKFKNHDILPLISILKYDYLSFNKKRGVPEFVSKKITKSEEEEVLKILKERNINNKVYIDKFFIDIKGFVNEGEIHYEEDYVVFDLLTENHILDVFVNKTGKLLTKTSN